MSFFEFLDNKYRNLGLDTQIEFSLAKDGFQQACHAWVITIRKFFKTVRIMTLPFEYLLSKTCLLPRDVDYKSRLDEMKAATKKILEEAERVKAAGGELPGNPADLTKPTVVTTSGQT